MFSVIIPLYNKADTVERAIRSVLNQTLSEFEIIVIDDGSTDNGGDIVKAICDSRITVIRQENAGVSAARNTGIAVARYEYLTFLDADDEYLPEFFAVMTKLIESYPHAGIYGCGYSLMYPSGKTSRPQIRGIPEKFFGIIPNYFEIAAKSAPPLWTGAVCTKRDAIRKIDGFPSGIIAGEDLLTWAKICNQHPLAYDSRIIAHYYIPAPEGYLPTRIPRKEDRDITEKEFLKLYRANNQKGIKKYIAFWYKTRISCFIRLGMRTDAFRESVWALRYDPMNSKLYAYILLCFLPEWLTQYTIKRYIRKRF